MRKSYVQIDGVLYEKVLSRIVLAVVALLWFSVTCLTLYHLLMAKSLAAGRAYGIIAPATTWSPPQT